MYMHNIAKNHYIHLSICTSYMYFIYLKRRCWLVGGLCVRHDSILVGDITEPASVHRWMLTVAEQT